MNLKKVWNKYNQIFFGGVLLTVIIISAVFAPIIAPYDLDADFKIRERLQPPSSEHLLGTDTFGRDTLTRIIYGARISMTIAFSVLVVCGFVGTLLGLLSGYFKSMEAIIMRLLDGLMAFPPVLLALVIVSALGAGLYNIVLALSIANIPRVARIVRSVVLSVKEYEHVEAAKAMGASDFRIILKYILPLCVSPLIVRLTLIMASTILAEASLTFLGVGLSPEVPSWGNMLSEGKIYMTTSPYVIIYPGLAIMTAVLGFNTFGDGLRDLLDPRLN